MRVAEQQFEVAVAHHQVALKLADAVLRAQLALQAVQGRPQEAVDQRKGARLDVLLPRDTTTPAAPTRLLPPSRSRKTYAACSLSIGSHTAADYDRRGRARQ